MRRSVVLVVVGGAFALWQVFTWYANPVVFAVGVGLAFFGALTICDFQEEEGDDTSL